MERIDKKSERIERVEGTVSSVWEGEGGVGERKEVREEVMEERRSGKSSCEVDAREVMSEIDEDERREREWRVKEFDLKPITLGSL